MYLKVIANLKKHFLLLPPSSNPINQVIIIELWKELEFLLFRTYNASDRVADSIFDYYNFYFEKLDNKLFRF